MRTGLTFAQWYKHSRYGSLAGSVILRLQHAASAMSHQASRGVACKITSDKSGHGTNKYCENATTETDEEPVPKNGQEPTGIGAPKLRLGKPELSGP